MGDVRSRQRRSSWVAVRSDEAHNPSMTLNQASLLAFIGTLLLAIYLVGDFILDLLSMARGLIPAVTLLTSLIRTFAAVTVAVFFYVFHRAQS